MLSAAELENDIFVSYAHIEGQKGWISTFSRALEIRLAQTLGKTPRNFRDPKLQGNAYFGDCLGPNAPEDGGDGLEAHHLLPRTGLTPKPTGSSTGVALAAAPVLPEGESSGTG